MIIINSHINNLTPDVFQDLCDSYEELDTIRWILETRPSFDIKTNDHRTFLSACYNEDYNLARLLCEHEPDIYGIFNVVHSNNTTTFQHHINTKFEPRDEHIYIFRYRN